MNSMRLSMILHHWPDSIDCDNVMWSRDMDLGAISLKLLCTPEPQLQNNKISTYAQSDATILQVTNFPKPVVKPGQVMVKVRCFLLSSARCTFQERKRLLHPSLQVTYWVNENKSWIWTWKECSVQTCTRVPDVAPIHVVAARRCQNLVMYAILQNEDVLVSDLDMIAINKLFKPVQVCLYFWVAASHELY